MRKVLAILLFSVFIFTLTGTSELMKLPVLMEHFVEHRALNSSISFIEFLDLHYMHGSPHDGDYERDMQLPFKMITHVSFAITTYTIPTNIPVIFTPIYGYKEKKTALQHTADYSFYYLSSIWQPPKSC